MAPGRWRLLTGSYQDGPGCTMCTWTEEGVYEGAMTEEPDESVTSMAAYEEGAGRWRLLTGLEDGTAKVWTPQGNCVATLSGQHTEALTSVAVFEEAPGRWGLLTGSTDGTARLWFKSELNFALHSVTLTGHMSELIASEDSSSGSDEEVRPHPLGVQWFSGKHCHFDLGGAVAFRS